MQILTSRVALRTLAALASLFMPCLAQAAGEGAAAGPVQRADSVRIRNARHALGVRYALMRASRTLAKENCQRIFEEFRDGDGRPLREILDAEARSGEDHLASLLFYDGSAHPRCRSKHTWAVTSPGSRIILVCTTQFADLAEQHPRVASGVLIHEQLHALGLGENPPTSTEITERVMQLCAP
jgi:hypothetical protein